MKHMFLFLIFLVFVGCGTTIERQQREMDEMVNGIKVGPELDNNNNYAVIPSEVVEIASSGLGRVIVMRVSDGELFSAFVPLPFDVPVGHVVRGHFVQYRHNRSSVAFILLLEKN